MIKVAITGKIGSGKTTVSEIISNLGYKVFEADKIVKNLFLDQKVIHSIREKFESKIPNLLLKNQFINKVLLSDFVFSNKKELENLENILHPNIKKEQETFENLNINEKVLFFDIPLLFEKKLHLNYDLIIYLKVSRPLQKARVLKRKDMTIKKLKDILSIQTHKYSDIKKFIAIELNMKEDLKSIKERVINFINKSLS